VFRVVRVSTGPDGNLHAVTPVSAVVFCDEPDCGAMAGVAFPHADARQGHQAALQAFARIGWLLDLDRHRCPGYARVFLQAQPLIQVSDRIGQLDGQIRGRG
jgi:hypothetical protein